MWEKLWLSPASRSGATIGDFLERWPAILLLVLIGFAAVYFLLPSQQYDPDILPELGRVDALDVSSPDPAHMLYVLIGIPFYQLWLLFGYTGDALRAMQVVNAFSGATAMVALVLILRQIGVRRGVAVPVTVSAGLSYAFWTHTEDAFFIIPAACSVLIAWLCAMVLADAQSPARRSVILPVLAASLSLAVLFYQTNLLVIPALVASSWSGRGRCRRWIFEWLFVLVLASVVAGGVWLYQGIRFAETDTLGDLLRWFVEGHGGIARGLWRREGVPLVSTTLIAWVATVLPIYEGMRLRDLLYHGRISLRHLPSQLALLLLGCTVGVSVNVLRGAQQKREPIVPCRVWFACTLWFVIPGLAVLWFDRAEVKLWLIPFFAVWVLLAAILDAGWRLIRHHRWPLRLVWLLPLAIGAGTFLLAVWPDHAVESVEIQKAQLAISHMQPQDLLISAGFDWTQYVKHFCPECRVVNAVAIAQTTARGEEHLVLSALLRHMRNTWDRGGQVYAAEYFGVPTDAIWSEWVTPYTGILPRDLAQFDKEVGWQVNGETVWRLEPGAAP